MPTLPLRCRPALGLMLAASLALMPAQAQARRSTTQATGAQQQRSEPEVAWTAGSEPGDCQRSRRKFWQAGEGWVVRTVTTCR